MPAVPNAAYRSGRALWTAVKTRVSASTAGESPVTRKGPTLAVFVSFCNAGDDVPQFGSGVPGFPSAVIIVACDAELRFALIPLGIGTVAVRFVDDELLELASGTALAEESLDAPPLEELSLEEPSLDEPSLEELSLEEPSLDEPLLEELSLEEPSLDEPSLEELSLEDPSLEALSLEEPPSKELSLEEPLSDVLSLEEPLLESSWYAIVSRSIHLLGRRLGENGIFPHADTPASHVH